MALVKCPECGGDVSEKAVVCPHCGYPVTPETDTVYALAPGKPVASSFATFLRVLAVICAVGGLIIAIAGANITVYDGYRTSTQFSFGTFLTVLAPYAIYTVILFGMAGMAEEISNIHGMVRGMRLGSAMKEKKTFSVFGKRIDPQAVKTPAEKAPDTDAAGASEGVPAAGGKASPVPVDESHEKCSICGQVQPAGRVVCWKCGTEFVCSRKNPEREKILDQLKLQYDRGEITEEEYVSKAGDVW